MCIYFSICGVGTREKRDQKLKTNNILEAAELLIENGYLNLMLLKL